MHENANSERPQPASARPGENSDRDNALGSRWCSVMCADHTKPAEAFCGFTLCALQAFTFLCTSSQTV